MANRDLILNLPATPGYLYQRVEAAIQEAILDGRLKPGGYLPGTRSLSLQLGVNRRTVIFALEHLEAEGWLTSTPCRGACVAMQLPGGRLPPPEAPGPPEEGIGFDLPSLLQAVSVTPTGVLSLADGVSDPRLAPGEAISHGYQRAMKRHGSTLLQNRHPQGNLLLREMLAGWLSERQGLALGPERILITRGSRSSLALLIYGFFKKGEVAAVETPGNRAAWDVFRSGTQIVLRGLPVDEEGVDPEALQELLREERVRLLYLTPRRQFPTGQSMSATRAKRILALAKAHRLAILEDDYDAEFHYGDTPPRSLLSLDPGGQVIQMGSLSRMIAPGLRISYLVVPESLAPFLARIQQRLDEHGDAVLEWAIGDLIRDGEFARHLRRVRKVYQGRRDHLLRLLEDRFRGALTARPSQGGMSLWVQGAGGLDLELLARSAVQRGLLLNPPSWYRLDGQGDGIRIGFTQATGEEMEEAVARLAQAWEAFR